MERENSSDDNTIILENILGYIRGSIFIYFCFVGVCHALHKESYSQNYK